MMRECMSRRCPPTRTGTSLGQTPTPDHPRGEARLPPSFRRVTIKGDPEAEGPVCAKERGRPGSRAKKRAGREKRPRGSEISGDRLEDAAPARKLPYGF